MRSSFCSPPLVVAYFCREGGMMLTLSSTTEMLAALRGAHDVTFIAYILPPGRVLAGLEAAARDGTHVCVRLEGSVYGDGGRLNALNAAAVARLQADGADARLVHGGSDDTAGMLHAKAAVIDGTLFLGDRNFPDRGADTIVRDDFPADVRMAADMARGVQDAPTSSFATTKRGALASEARLVGEAGAGDDVIVESESFGRGNAVYNAIDGAARRGARVSVLVNARVARGNLREAAAIAKLEEDGVAVRTCSGEEKFAIVRGARGWIGSANVTAAFDHPDEFDWGARTDQPDILAHARAAFDARWAAAGH
jgi:phosphatidylserine/phosphatidylglycerophosphate/cardiolipin synthase-like enzyme